ncbi:acetyltransferase (GNAT) family protein [Streptomyces sp. 3211.6]|uniref:GNAT family N-acetyltransferase n=1 Tax=unclassified Streptomyces TaxID=2593676 RepID=UPI000EAC4EFA|nr:MULTISPECIES: GNAT family N-acetyltransferase [unclassified Streptomyces]RKT08523.1 acetyltransferase (GNAT) family protein [Streptomyces sp. 3211.6]RPF29922.1 acetyltransferase (GNAT) family protein [Streptomyces sp. Ag109_G2-6]
MITTRADGLTLDTDPARIDLDRVHHWLSTDAFWALGRSRETVARSIEHSLVFGVYVPDTAEQLAFARVVTDYATFGWLCDVYVAREARGQGIGTWLAESVVAALEPYRLKRLMLSTLDAHEVYAHAGFSAVSEPEKLMMITAQAPSTAPADPATGAVKPLATDLER